jgi:hypothetical protein
MGVTATRAAEEAAARPRGVTSRPITDDLEHPRGRSGRPTCRASPPPFFIFFFSCLFFSTERESTICSGSSGNPAFRTARGALADGAGRFLLALVSAADNIWNALSEFWWITGLDSELGNAMSAADAVFNLAGRREVCACVCELHADTQSQAAHQWVKRASHTAIP